MSIQKSACTEARLDDTHTFAINVNPLPFADPYGINDVLRLRGPFASPDVLLDKLLNFLPVSCLNEIPILIDLLFSEVVCIGVNLESLKGIEINVEADISFPRSLEYKMSLILGP